MTGSAAAQGRQMRRRLTGCMTALFAILCFVVQTAGTPFLATFDGAASGARGRPTTELPSTVLRLTVIKPLEDPAPKADSTLHRDISLLEPFGGVWVTASVPDLWRKWSEVEKQIQADRQTLADCRIRPATCTPAAERLLSIIDEGHGRVDIPRIGLINRGINMAIQPRRAEDRWNGALETFTTGRGDCKDYAIAKYVALLEAGIPEIDLRIVIVHLRATNENHAIVAVRFDDEWITLDNRTLILVRDVEMPLVTPLFVIDERNVREIATATNPATAVAAAKRDSMTN